MNEFLKKNFFLGAKLGLESSSSPRELLVTVTMLVRKTFLGSFWRFLRMLCVLITFSGTGRMSKGFCAGSSFEPGNSADSCSRWLRLDRLNEADECSDISWIRSRILL